MTSYIYVYIYIHEMKNECSIFMYKNKINL